MQRAPLSVLATAGLLLALAPNASAHIELIEPPARYEITDFETGIKSCPCGLGSSNRTCNLMTDSSDDARSTDRVSRFEAGSTITLRLNEYVNHSGRFRVAFDPDGADMADFNANVLTDIPDPNNANDTEWEIEVTLPTVTCNNCTLQVVQAMHGDTENPVVDPAPLSSYYACVDLELVAPGTLEGEPAAPEPTPAGEAPMDPGSMENETETDAAASGAPMDGPLVPVGEPLPTDASGAGGGTPEADPAGEMVAMNTPSGDSTALPAADGVPDIAMSGGSGSSGGGCAIGLQSAGSGAGLGALGLLSLVGLRRLRARSMRR